MYNKRVVPVAVVILVLAVCAFFVGLAIGNVWVSVPAICIATLAVIYAMAFYLQGR